MPEQHPETENQDTLVSSPFYKFMLISTSVVSGVSAAEAIGHHEPVVAVVGALAVYKVGTLLFTIADECLFGDEVLESPDK